MKRCVREARLNDNGETVCHSSGGDGGREGGPFSIGYSLASLAGAEYNDDSNLAASTMDHSAVWRSVLAVARIALCSLVVVTNQCSIAVANPQRLPEHQALHRQAEPPKQRYRDIFSDIERGLSTGNVNGFAGVFAPEVQVNLRGGESGYFSSHQAYYLLDTYLRSRRLANLTFTTIGESDVNPYATGGANLFYRGSREYVQVYVALSLAGDRWVISRINIY